MSHDSNQKALLEEAIQRLQAATCRCPDDQLEVRRRTYSEISKHLVLQCTRCGEQRGSPLNKAQAAARLAGRQPMDFDVEIEESYHSHLEDLSNAVRLLNRQALQAEPTEWFVRQESLQRQAAYLESVTEECATTLIAEAGVGEAANALARKAVALRRSQREAERLTTYRFPDEASLKSWLVKNMSSDFELLPEVPGRHLAAGVGVKIDFVAVAREHLVKEGFTPLPFGIEVKHLDPFSEFSRRAARAFWQTITYTDSEFSFKGDQVGLKFALLFSNMSFDVENSLLNRTGEVSENDGALWDGLRQLANHANVGTFEVRGPHDAFCGWKIAFSGGTYFSRRDHARKSTYSLSNQNMIDKRRIGNF